MSLRAILGLGALALLITVIQVLAFPPDPLAMDSATYAVIARELRAGETLYLDNWDIKPPVVYGIWAAAQAILGYGQGEPAVVNLTFMILTMLGVFAATRFAGRSEFIGLLAAALWALVAATPTLEGHQPNTEVFINATETAAFAVLLFAATRRAGLPTSVAIGLLFALASMYKPIAVVFAVLTTGAYVLSDTAGPLRLRLRNAAVMGGVAAACWLGIFGYFALAGRFGAFWDANFVFTRGYAGNLVLNVMSGLQPTRLLPTFAYPVYPLFGGAVLAAVLARRSRWNAAMLLGVAFGVACFAQVALPGRFFNHYYQLWLPALCIGTAWALDALRQRHGVALFRWATAAILLMTIGLQLGLLRRSSEEWSREIWKGRLLHNQRAARVINRLLEPDETFFQWGHHVELYYYTGRRPPAGEFRAGPIFQGARTHERLQRVLEDLATNRPELLLSTGSWSFVRDRDPVSRWALEHYAPFWPPGDELYDPRRIRFYYRKDGRLEYRLRQAQVIESTAGRPARSAAGGS